MQVPNSNDFGDPTKVLHHTTAEENFNQEHRCFQEVTCCQVLILLLSHIHHPLCTLYSRPASGQSCKSCNPHNHRHCIIFICAVQSQHSNLVFLTKPAGLWTCRPLSVFLTKLAGPWTCRPPSVTTLQPCFPDNACCPMDLQTNIRAILHTCNPNNPCHSVVFNCVHQSQHSNPYFLTVYGLADHHQGYLRCL